MILDDYTKPKREKKAIRLYTSNGQSKLADIDDRYCVFRNGIHLPLPGTKPDQIQVGDMMPWGLGGDIMQLQPIVKIERASR